MLLVKLDGIYHCIAEYPPALGCYGVNGCHSLKEGEEAGKVKLYLTFSKQCSRMGVRTSGC